MTPTRAQEFAETWNGGDVAHVASTFCRGRRHSRLRRAQAARRELRGTGATRFTAPRLPPGERPTIPDDGAIPGAPEPLPDVMSYDPGTRELHIGAGRIGNVTPAMWAYEVSGKNVLRQWFGYRKRDRSKADHRRPPAAVSAR